MTREQILARRERIAERVRGIIRQAEHWNALHPDERQLEHDDAQGTLSTSLATIGLDLRTLIADVKAGE